MHLESPFLEQQIAAQPFARHGAVAPPAGVGERAGLHGMVKEAVKECAIEYHLIF